MNTLNIVVVIAILDISIGTIYLLTASKFTEGSYDPEEKDDLLQTKSNFGNSLSSLTSDINVEDSTYNDYSESNAMTPTKDRLAVIAYVPNNVGQAYQFLVLLYGSWKYITDHQKELNKDDKETANDVDLLVFCHPNICKEIKHVCTKINGLREITTSTKQKCWAVEQPFETDIPYGPLNSFIMFNRTDIEELKPRYKYLFRTDNDVFVTPAIHKLKPKRFLHGHGGYSDPFNMKRLKEVAQRLQMVHRGRHAIGSTWCGETRFFIEVSKKTLETTRYIWLNEFKPTAKGLETINFKANNQGEWIRWWRPVSLLYGGEIVLNHMVEDISDENKGQFDTPVCKNISIWETPHIHCWHDNCKFQKFKFMKYLNIAITSRESLPGDVVHRIIESTYTKDVRRMNLQEYSTFIAWNSACKYLKKWFV